MSNTEQAMTYEKLADHACMSASDYLFRAIETVNKQMGDGAAERFPQIVAAVMQASASEYAASMISHRVVPALNGLTYQVGLVADALNE